MNIYSFVEGYDKRKTCHCEGVLRGYRNRHCEEGRSPDVAI
ncbi:hypothetical protein [Rickettsia endosymbiont of Ceutorhynchus obstrictus]